ncbi:MAG: OmpA family protein [Azoarcus sp.]|nr:OmpA family protein [Azoarcus sp.]
MTDKTMTISPNAQCHPLRALAPLAAVLMLTACAQTTPVAVEESAAPTVAATMQHPPSAAVDWPVLQKELKTALLDVPDNHIAHLPAGLRVSLPACDGFAPGRVDVRAPLATLLTRVAPVLQRYPGASIQVIGHTDGVGSEMNNLRLSIERAEAVVDYLRTQGVDLGRMVADGKGENEPIADNTKPDGRARNQRVEIFLKS